MVKPRCFLDMDGVLDDFNAGVHKLHGRSNLYDNPKFLKLLDIEVVWVIKQEEFWAPIQSTPGFWYSLPKTPEADQIVDLVVRNFGVENVCVLSSPAIGDPNCIPEKRAWINKYYPQFSKQMLFGGCKQFLAGPGRVLVDDRDKNIEEFAAAGGWGVTVPRPWNKLYSQFENVVSIVEFGLKMWTREYYKETKYGR